MKHAGSDNDDIFSELREMRRQFRLKGALEGLSPTTAPEATPKDSKASEHHKAGDNCTQRKHQLQHTPSRQSKARAVRDGDTSTPVNASRSRTEARQQEKKHTLRRPNRMARTPLKTPLRTPESRLVKKLSPAASSEPTPELNSHAGASQRTPRNTFNVDSPNDNPKARRLSSILSSTPNRLSPQAPTAWNTELLFSTPKTSRASPASSSSSHPHGSWMNSPVALGPNSRAKLNFDIPDPYQEAGPGDFGLLGSVKDALVTEADIDKAKLKLGEEQALTQQQIIREIRSRLLAFSSKIDPEILLLNNSETEVWRSTTLLCQFYTLGHGSLTYASDGVVWQGSMLGPVATVAESNGQRAAGKGVDMSDAALIFPWNRMTAVRTKSIDDSVYILLTIDEDMGVAFRFEGKQTSERISDCANVLANNLKIRQSKQATAASDINRAPDPNATESADNYEKHDTVDIDQLSLRLLARVCESHKDKYSSTDIKLITSNQRFTEYAKSLLYKASTDLSDYVSDFYRITKENGATTDDEDITETLPGMCTLCYADEESVNLLPCTHKICDSCFMHLQSMQASSSQESTADAVCVCPWDRNAIVEWTRINDGDM